MKVYLPEEGSNGQCYHARVCGAHRLVKREVTPLDLFYMDVRACGHCKNNAGLPTIDELLIDKLDATDGYEVHVNEEEFLIICEDELPEWTKHWLHERDWDMYKHDRGYRVKY